MNNSESLSPSNRRIHDIIKVIDFDAAVNCSYIIEVDGSFKVFSCKSQDLYEIISQYVIINHSIVWVNICDDTSMYKPKEGITKEQNETISAFRCVVKTHLQTKKRK